ncbi:MAG TPA: hypothetical protein VG406_24465 [Isosphaeraceae bacterium]|jgi:hypothetical protein|nr:hypothetical protein [Isosphaeraceae bacterium]
MLWRHLGLARAWSAAGLLLGTTLLGGVGRADEPGRAPARGGGPTVETLIRAAVEAKPKGQADADRAAPAPTRDADPGRVAVLDGQRSGDLQVKVRGHGADRVKFSIRNTTDRRLRVIIPPGLVASASPLGQPGGRGGGGGGAGGAFQSMGLGAPTNRAGGFGAFTPGLTRPGTGSSPGSAAFQSVPAEDPRTADGVVVPAGKAVEFLMPSVCLNFGITTPTDDNIFTLMDVDQYTPDPRARKALRSLATLGTSQKVAQAVMWHVYNGMTYQQLALQTVVPFNAHEMALANRVVEALDASGPNGILDPAELARARVFVRVTGESSLDKGAFHLSNDLAGRALLGLPIQVVDAKDDPASLAPALLLHVHLTSSKPGLTKGRIAVRHATAQGSWGPLGTAQLEVPAAISDVDADALCLAIDRAVASTFVRVAPMGRTAGVTTFRVQNRLPFTLAGLVVETAADGKAGATTSFDALGVGPLREGRVNIPAARGRAERVVLNGL